MFDRAHVRFDEYGRRLKHHCSRWMIPLIWISGVLLVPVVIAAPGCGKYGLIKVVEVKNEVSKHTTEAWAKWRVGHPNWKPNPKVVRPKYKMVKVTEEVDLICAPPPPPTPPKTELTIDISTSAETSMEIPMIPMISMDIPAVGLTQSPSDTTPLTFPPPFAFAPILPFVPVVFSPPSPPPPPLPPPIALTPEPSSLWLLGTGLVFMAVMVKRHARIH